MNSTHSVLIARFLEEHQADIRAIFEQAYVQVGGHYAALSAARRREQAVLDVQQFTADLVRGGPDLQSIQQTVSQVADNTIPADIVNLASINEPLFRAFVQEQLADQPEVAQELLRRAGSVFARFRLNMASAQIENVIQQTPPRPSRPPRSPQD